MEETNGRESLYSQVTSRIIVDIKEERLPWVQPWEAPTISSFRQEEQ